MEKMSVESGSDEESSQFEIKAINHDNAREAEELTNLFVRQYGKTFPLKEVYDPQFWCSERLSSANSDEGETDLPFTSLVAMHGDRMVGHIAVKSCPLSRQAEIYLPVVDPDYRRHAIRLSFQFWRCLENLAHKQGWKRIVHYYCSIDPIFQIVAAKCFGSHEIAQIPLIDTSGETSAVVDGQPPLLTVLFNQIDSTHELTTIFPPDEHLLILEQLYRNLSIPREFSLDTALDDRSGFRPAGNRLFNGADQAPAAADDDPYEIHVNPALRVKELRLRPQQIGGRDELRALVRAVLHRCETDQLSLVILLPLEDRKTPALVKTLQNSGFHFAGILPECSEGDQILFSLSPKPFSLERSGRLAAESRAFEELSTPPIEARRNLR